MENNSPFSAYLERKNFTIISSSPEMFLYCNNKKVETRPIKGTAPRDHNNTQRDNKLAEDLLESKKNQAELFMIVDLLRNDLNRVCKTGSVRVINEKRIETYRNVHHLVSIIRGDLMEELDYIDLLKGTFPGGINNRLPQGKFLKCYRRIGKIL
jgi:para-aminobenzoate synthetase component I